MLQIYMKSIFKFLLATDPAEPKVIVKQGFIAVLISFIPFIGIISFPIYVCFIFRIYKTMKARYMPKGTKK